MRKAKMERETKETTIHADIILDGNGDNDIKCSIGFFTHMLESLSKHSLIDIKLEAIGDVHVDYHHLVEDTAITLGKTIIEALGDKKGINRFGSSILPLDDALVESVLDISGRPYFESNLKNFKGSIGDFDFELVEVFFSGFASMGYNLHIEVKKGNNLHHIAESAFKSFARALMQAISVNNRIKDKIPSTKEYIQK